MVSMRISMEQSLKCREVGFEMAIYLHRVAEDKLRRICSQDSYCNRFYLSSRRGKFGLKALSRSVTVRNCAGPIPRVESELHIGERVFTDFTLYRIAFICLLLFKRRIFTKKLTKKLF